MPVSICPIKLLLGDATRCRVANQPAACETVGRAADLRVTKRKPLDIYVEGRLKEAERTGFEPAVGFDPYTGLANRRFRPLSHLSR
jgi:hypothetical protein